MRQEFVRFILRIQKPLFDKLSYIADHGFRSKNREIEQLIKHRIADLEAEHGEIEK